MRYEPDKIEEKLVPYIEGVLNAKEKREVDAAINSDAKLAREVAELREVIGELRQGFASGLKAPQEKLSAEEVVELSMGAGGVENLPGTSEGKAKLFCSDEALEEVALLRALSEEMERTTLDERHVPALPDSLRTEFGRLKGKGHRAKVIPLGQRLAQAPAWQKTAGWLDRLNPKPLMASAAALMLLSFGLHMYQNQPATEASQGEQVASSVEATPSFGASPLDKSSADQTPDDGVVAAPKKARSEPDGITVFTSDDRDLLNDQASRLLEGNVRYTVTGDRILVADRDVKKARAILWGQENGPAVASAEEKTESRMERAAQEETEASSEAVPAPPPEPEPVVIEPDEVEPPRFYAPERSGPPLAAAAPSDNEARKETSESDALRTEGEPAPAASSAAPRTMKSLPAYQPRANTRSALKPKGSSSVLNDFTVYSSKDTPSPRRQSAPARPLSTEETGEAAPGERRSKLRDLALGQSQSDEEAPRPTKVVDEDWELAEESPSNASASKNYEQTRARANTPLELEREAVANAVTAEKTSRTDGRVASGSGPSSAGAAPAGRISEADARLAAVGSKQAAVAKRHGVELSVQSNMGRLTVYVRPNKELSKDEIETLRKALRQELNLLDSDTIIIR